MKASLSQNVVPFLNILSHYKHFGQFCTIFSHFEQLLQPFWTIFDDFESSWTYFNNLTPFLTFFLKKTFLTVMSKFWNICTPLPKKCWKGGTHSPPQRWLWFLAFLYREHLLREGFCLIEISVVFSWQIP